MEEKGIELNDHFKEFLEKCNEEDLKNAVEIISEIREMSPFYKRIIHVPYSEIVRQWNDKED